MGKARLSVGTAAFFSSLGFCELFVLSPLGSLESLCGREFWKFWPSGQVQYAGGS
jgi:hypothetical protein